MKYLGEYRPDYFDGYNWHNAYVYCPAETGDEAMHCLHYEPIDNIEWMCRSCSGDTCQRRMNKKLPKVCLNQRHGKCL